MSENKNVIIQQNNRIDYDVLFPKNNSWKKEEIAITETFQKYGLDANAIPKDLFDYLISQIKSEYGKTYIWKRWKWTFTPEENANGIVYSSSVYMDYTGTVYVAQFDSVQVHRDGVTYTRTPKQILSLKKYSEIPANFYYSNLFKTYAEAASAPPVCYGGEDTEEGGNRGTIAPGPTYLSLKFVSVLSDRVTKTDESTITSSNSSAYSESDLPDTEGYFYQKDGDMSSPTFGQVYNSYYIGVGKYGVSNKNSIVCSGSPKLVFVRNHSSTNGGNIAIFVYPSQSAYGIQTNSSSDLIVTWGDNSISWYATYSNENYQLNGNNSRYDFVVIQTI